MHWVGLTIVSLFCQLISLFCLFPSFLLFLSPSVLSCFLFFSDPSYRFFFQFIYHLLCSISTLHVYVGFWGFLFVPSSTSWNFLWATVRLPAFCSGITSTLMRPESWLRGNQCGGNCGYRYLFTSSSLSLVGYPFFSGDIIPRSSGNHTAAWSSSDAYCQGV